MSIAINVLLSLLLGWPAMILGYFYAAAKDGFKSGLWWYDYHNKKTCVFLHDLSK